MKLIYHPIRNYDPKENEYSETQFNRFLNNEFNFAQIKTIEDYHITDYDKLFYYNKTLQPVAPTDMHIEKYKDHIKSYKYLYVDNTNKTMLISSVPKERNK